MTASAGEQFAAYAAAVAFSQTRPPSSAAATPLEFAHAPGIERLRGNLDGTIAPPPSWYLLGWRLTEVSEGSVAFEFEPMAAHASYGGTAHGGILASLADSAMGCATVSLLPADHWCALVQLNSHYLRPVAAPGPVVSAIGRVRHRGKLTATVDAVLQQDGLEMVLASSTYAIRPNRPMPGEPPGPA